MNDMLRQNLTPKKPIYINISNKDLFYCAFLMFFNLIYLYFRHLKSIFKDILNCIGQGLLSVNDKIKDIIYEYFIN